MIIGDNDDFYEEKRNRNDIDNMKQYTSQSPLINLIRNLEMKNQNNLQQNDQRKFSNKNFQQYLLQNPSEQHEQQKLIYEGQNTIDFPQNHEMFQQDNLDLINEKYYLQKDNDYKYIL